jgi:small subunit ribosomal protein S17
MEKQMDKILRTKLGTVTSDKMDKTIVVSVDRVKEHPLYKKKFTVSTKYKVHDEKNECKTGDIVEFTSTRPVSKEKKYKVVRKIVK